MRSLEYVLIRLLFGAVRSAVRQSSQYSVRSFTSSRQSRIRCSFDSSTSSITRTREKPDFVAFESRLSESAVFVEARLSVESAEAAYNRAQEDCRKSERALMVQGFWQVFLTPVAKLVLAVRITLTRTLTREVSLFLISAMIAAIALVNSYKASESIANSIGLTSVILFCCIPLLFCLFFVPSDKRLQAFVTLRDLELGRKRLAVNLAYDRLASANSILRNSREEVDKLEGELRVNKLRSANQRSMQGYEFEVYLRQIFSTHGFDLETTPRAGDQGVDLILSRGGRRIAVQDKGYPSMKSVGNGAVQAVNAEMGYYSCDCAVVITNSRFTKSAAELAAKLGCKLVDSSDFHRLIEGRFEL